MMNKELYDLVVEAYTNAIENGYDLKTWSDLDVADDMLNYDAEIAVYTIEEVLDCVKYYRKSLK